MRTLSRMAVVLFMAVLLVGCDDKEPAPPVYPVEEPITVNTINGVWESLELYTSCSLSKHLTVHSHLYKYEFSVPKATSDPISPCTADVKMFSLYIDNDVLVTLVNNTQYRYTIDYSPKSLGGSGQLILTLIGDELPIVTSNGVTVNYDLTGRYVRITGI